MKISLCTGHCSDTDLISTELASQTLFYHVFYCGLTQKTNVLCPMVMILFICYDLLVVKA